MTLIGKTIGHIRIVNVLGKGGMGEVYAGYDDTLKRHVALKAIGAQFRLDPQAKARFLREARVLSQLKHPNICQIHDYIEGDGNDYLILEFIEGTNLRQAISEGIDKSHKLGIAEQIVQVLVIAHEKGIVHRDLKPSNVMLTKDNQVKVLDFGLAGYTRFMREFTHPAERDTIEAEDIDWEQSLSPAEFTMTLPQRQSSNAQEALSDIESQPTVETKHGTVMGTPLYMSPEQARGEPIHAASDIYSFGLLLQNLFTGLEPYEDTSDKDELLKKVRQAETRPLTGLGSDLTLLINRLKSYAPTARPTAVEILDRLRQIREKPKRRVRRLLAACIISAFVLVGIKYTIDLRQERKLAFEARDEAAGVVDFLIDLFEVSDPGEARGNTITAREILRKGAEDIEQGLQRQPLTRAKLMDTIGTVYRKLGLYLESELLAKKSLEIRRNYLEPEDTGIAESLMSLSILSELQGKYDDAEKLAMQSLDIRMKNLPPDHPQIAECLHHLGLIDLRLGNLDKAEPYYLQALEIREKALGPDHPDVSDTLRELGVLYHNQGRYNEAELLYKRALTIRETILGLDHPDVGRTLNSLGALYFKQGRYAEAEPLYRRALAIREKTLGQAHPEVAICILNLAHLFYNQDRIQEAETLYRQALEIREKALGPDHPDVAESINNLANVFLIDERYGEAESSYLRALAIWEKAYKPDHPRIAECLNNLAILYFYQSKFDQAEEFYKKALEIREKSLGKDHLNVSYSLGDLAYLYFAMDRLDEAEPLYLRALAIQEKILGKDHLMLAGLHDSISTMYEKMGSYQDAEKYSLRSLVIRENHPEEDQGGLTITLSNLASLYHHRLLRLEEAESFYRRTLEIREKIKETDKEEMLALLENYLDLLQALGREKQIKELKARYKLD
jgi:serine/threonine protein kinase/Tfp pilus assembly protein PilF